MCDRGGQYFGFRNDRAKTSARHHDSRADCPASPACPWGGRFLPVRLRPHAAPAIPRLVRSGVPPSARFRQILLRGSQPPGSSGDQLVLPQDDPDRIVTAGMVPIAHIRAIRLVCPPGNPKHPTLNSYGLIPGLTGTRSIATFFINN